MLIHGSHVGVDLEAIPAVVDPTYDAFDVGAAYPFDARRGALRAKFSAGGSEIATQSVILRISAGFARFAGFVEVVLHFAAGAVDGEAGGTDDFAARFWADC